MFYLFFSSVVLLHVKIKIMVLLIHKTASLILVI